MPKRKAPAQAEEANSGYVSDIQFPSSKRPAKASIVPSTVAIQKLDVQVITNEDGLSTPQRQISTGAW